MAKTIFEPNYYKVRLCFGRLLGSQIFKNGAEWLPRRPLRKTLQKETENDPNLTPLTCLNCVRGLKNHGSKGLRKSFPKDLQRHPFGRLFGVHSHPRAAKPWSMWEVSFWYRFREVDTVRRRPPPRKRHFWRPSGEDNRRGRGNREPHTPDDPKGGRRIVLISTAALFYVMTQVPMDVT